MFIDAGIDNYQQLLDDLNNRDDATRDLEVVIIESDQDGLELISESLKDRTGLDGVHILSHGSDGSVSLGNARLDADTLAQNELQVSLWANAFTEAGDILIYGCNLAQTQAGESLINTARRADDDRRGRVRRPDRARQPRW